MSERLVKCAKLGRELAGLEKPPFGGPLGQQIFENISQQAWLMWRDDMQIKVLNEYRLNMGLRSDYEKLVEQMLIFLNLKQGAHAEVENSSRGGVKKQ